MMEMRGIYAILIALFCISNAKGADISDTEFGKFTAEEYQACFDVIICKLRKPQEFRRFLVKAGPKMQELAYKWLRERELMPDAADTKEFWEKYPTYKCAHTEEKKKEYYNVWFQQSGQYLASVCKQVTNMECIGMEEMGREMNLVMGEYLATGDCSSEAAEKAKAEAEKLGKQGAEHLAKADPKNFPGMPAQPPSLKKLG